MSPDLEAFLLARANPTEENVQRAIRATRTTRQTDPRTLGNLVQALGEFHREDELYDVLMNFPRAEFLGDLSEIYFRPALVSFRRDPRFMQVAKRAGLLNYWRTSRKWPDFCFEADLHYDCKTEAANLAG